MTENPALFEKLQNYPFHKDLEFANGLAVLLGHPDTPATEEEMNREDDLVLQAKCFFFSRKENLTERIEFAAYKSWLTQPSTSDEKDLSNTGNSTCEPGAESSTGTEPAYPSSFAHIVELITTGQSIPGIEQIPDTVLTGHSISSEKPRRRKPWESDGQGQSQNEESMMQIT